MSGKNFNKEIVFSKKSNQEGREKVHLNAILEGVTNVNKSVKKLLDDINSNAVALMNKNISELSPEEKIEIEAYRIRNAQPKFNVEDSRKYATLEQKEKELFTIDEKIQLTAYSLWFHSRDALDVCTQKAREFHSV